MEYENRNEEKLVCGSCRRTLAPGARFCPYCGAGVNTGTVRTEQTPAGLTKKEYRKKYASAKLYKDLKSAAITGYVLAGINTAVMLFLNPAGLLDAGILLALVLGFHLGRSKGCAIGLLCFNIFSILVTLIVTGNITGWLWLIVSISALRTFNKIDREYKEQCGGMAEL